MDIAELITRVEAATGSDAVLDEAIYRAIDPQRALEIPLAPRLTESIDAALALVERVKPGCWHDIIHAALIDGDDMDWHPPPETPLEKLPRNIILALLRSISDRSS